MKKVILLAMLLLATACGTAPLERVATSTVQEGEADPDLQTAMYNPGPARTVVRSDADVLLVDLGNKTVEFYRRRAAGEYDLVFTGSALVAPRPERLTSEVVVGTARTLQRSRINVRWSSQPGWNGHIGALESYAEALPTPGAVALLQVDFNRLQVAMAQSARGVDVIFHRASYHAAPRATLVRRDVVMSDAGGSDTDGSGSTSEESQN